MNQIFPSVIKTETEVDDHDQRDRGDSMTGDHSTEIAAHTPGPWSVGNQNFSKPVPPPFACVQNDNSGLVLLLIPHDMETKREALANAHLIAAAPDMLAELKDILDWARTERAPLRPQEIASIERIIAKAEGRS